MTDILVYFNTAFCVTVVEETCVSVSKNVSASIEAGNIAIDVSVHKLQRKLSVKIQIFNNVVSHKMHYYKTTHCDRKDP